jgi:signal transduction histidine kinase
MDTWIENVLLNAGTVLDKVRVYEIKIKSYIAHHRLMDAVSTALQVLSLLDIHFPHKPNKLHVLYALAQIYITLGYRKIEDLVEMPAMKNPHKEAAIRILASVGSAAYFAFPDFFPLLVCKAFHMIIKYGNTPYSGFVCASYGLIVLGGLRDIRTSYRLGKTALQLIEKASSPHLSCRTGMMTNTFLFHWNEHLKHSLPSLYEAQQKGLETGDIEFTTYSIMVRCHNRLFLGDSLSEVSSEMLAMGKVIAELRQEIPLNMHNIFTQATLNLITPCEHPVFITGSVHNESEMLPFYRQTKAEVAIFQLFVCKLMMACLFDDHSQTEEILSVCGSHFKSIPASPFVPMYFMYESLARLNNLAEKHPDSQTLKIIKRNQKKLKNFARYAPMNSLHKFYLVKAELCRVTGKTQKAVALYEKASIQAKANGYVQEEALAYELAGRFYKSRQQLSLAQFYLQKAYKVYHEWGAFSKTRRMQQQYRPFFDESLEEKTDVLALQGIHAVADNLYTKFSNETSTVLFDLNSIMKAATAISSEIQLDKLLEKLIKIAVENAGAQKGYFILCKENAFFIEAESSVDEEEVIIASVPLRNNVSVSESIIQYAYLTKENVVLSNAIADPKFAADPVIVEKSSKSILCTPIINQMQVVGLLYFENNLTTSAFTQDRIELLRLLSGQMAVSIENALNEEKKVAAYQEREQLLKKINHQQEIIARSILKTQENERRRIAEDLHDGLGYTLSTLKLNLTSLQEIVKDNDDGKFLHNSFLLLEESFRELKSISNNLMPDILFRFGLIVAIDDLCKKINNTGQLFINFRYFNIKKKFRKDFEIEVYRVLQELINNTIKHAEARHLEIQFVNQGNLLVITVEDDGKGFDYQKKLKSKNKGKGLINIINRINFLQGELHVESGLNKGTTFILHLPLHIKSANPLDHDKVTSSRRSSAFH